MKIITKTSIVDTNPIVSTAFLESGTKVFWVDQSVNGLLKRSNEVK